MCAPSSPGHGKGGPGARGGTPGLPDQRDRARTCVFHRALEPDEVALGSRTQTGEQLRKIAQQCWRLTLQRELFIDPA